MVIKKKITPYIFKNIDDEPFVGYWDGVATTFQPGEEKELEEWLVNHYMKGLVDQIVNKKNVESFQTGLNGLLGEQLEKEIKKEKLVCASEPEPVKVETYSSEIKTEEKPQEPVFEDLASEEERKEKVKEQRRKIMANARKVRMENIAEKKK